MDSNITKLIADIKSVLTPELLTGQYAKNTPKSPTEGHCYAAAEALYHFLGGKEAGYTPQVASFMEGDIKCTHWWIKYKNGDILDPTAEQFTAIGYEPPYTSSKGAGFLTKNPSKRAAVIMDRVRKLRMERESNLESFTM